VLSPRNSKTAPPTEIEPEVFPIPPEQPREPEVPPVPEVLPIPSVPPEQPRQTRARQPPDRLTYYGPKFSSWCLRPWMTNQPHLPFYPPPIYGIPIDTFYPFSHQPPLYVPLAFPYQAGMNFFLY
jgi:hypothetical protein